MFHPFGGEERSLAQLIFGFPDSAVYSAVPRPPREEQSSFGHELTHIASHVNRLLGLLSFPREGQSAITRVASIDPIAASRFSEGFFSSPRVLEGQSAIARVASLDPIPVRRFSEGFFSSPREGQSAVAREASLDSSPVSLFPREVLQHYDEPRSEGYDEYFDPPLESKYKCPICLLGLREPMQTSCGHRFCRGCILRSIR